MQVKVVVGTIAFMLTMMIMGFAALREPVRLQEYTLAFQGRSVESGAKLFAGNCSTCHGVDGKAELCYNAAGEQIGCQGLPLNYNVLLCGDGADRTPRMAAMNWAGTKQDFIRSVVSAGRPGTAMPTWSEQFGGPMRQDQVDNVVAFVLNWESEELCSAPIITFDWPDTADTFLADFPDGDAVTGEELYVTYGCSGCHGSPDGTIPASVGPDLSNIAEEGATRVPGYSAAEYIYESILEPNAHIAEQCPTGPCLGPPSAMPANFAERMGASPEDLAHIMAYLLQQ